jgi:hypothetical protein
LLLTKEGDDLKIDADYINGFTFGAVLFLLLGLVELISGYSWSIGGGFFKLNNPVKTFTTNLVVALILVVVDVFYVMKKKERRKRGD